MARPSKNAEGPSATERMEMAFWECMKIMPFSEITVRDIVERAKVNRNSYYYHYESMWDLAQASVQHARLAELAHVLLGEDAQPVEEGAEPISQTQLDAAYDHLRILASENGSQRLLDDAKRVVSSEWMAMYKLDPESSSSDIRLAVDFTFGGITALLAGADFANLSRYSKTIEESDLLLDTFDLLRSELDPAVDSKNRWLRRSSMKRTEETIIIEHVVGDSLISDSVVDEIMADVKSAQVNEVLAPSTGAVENPVLETHTDPAPDSVIEVVTESKIERDTVTNELESEETAKLQEPSDSREPAETPTERNPVESVAEKAVEDSEETENAQDEKIEESAEQEEQSAPDETKRAMEDDHEEHAEQEPDAEQEDEEDFAPVEAIGVVSALESLQEIELDDEDEQEPVRIYDASALSDPDDDDDLDELESAISYQNEEDDEIDEDEDDAESEFELSYDLDMVLVDEADDEEEEDDQLTMDFLF